jgi:hypothetical protein
VHVCLHLRQENIKLALFGFVFSQAADWHIAIIPFEIRAYAILLFLKLALFFQLVFPCFSMNYEQRTMNHEIGFVFSNMLIPNKHALSIVEGSGNHEDHEVFAFSLSHFYSLRTMNHE